MAMSHSADAQQSHSSWYCGSFVVEKESYCARTATLQSFCEVNRCDAAIIMYAVIIYLAPLISTNNFCLALHALITTSASRQSKE